MWTWIVGGMLSLWAMLAPDSLRPLYNGWMRFGLLMNRVTTPLLLGIVFYLLIFPMGLLMRLFGADPMRRKLDPSANTYRVESRAAAPETMERPF